MADAFTAAQTGIDPTTGSYLSPSARKALFRSATVSGSVFGGGGGALVRQPKSELATAQGVQLLESNQQTLGTITEQLNSLRDQIASLTTGINSIASQIANESAVENSRLQEEQDQQRKLAEAEVRIGRENELEQKLQNALVAPVQRATQKTMGFLERIKQALMALLGGWLTNQILDLFQASKDENKTKFDEIKNNIIKNLFYAGGAFLAINTGFNIFLGIAGRVAGLIAKLSAKILTAPFRAAGALATSIFRPKGNTPPPSTSSPKGSPPKIKGGGLLSNALNLAAGTFDFMNRKSEGQTNLQAGAGSLTSMAFSQKGMQFGSKLPGWLKLPGMVLGGAAGWTMGGGLSDFFTGANKNKEQPGSAETSSNTTTTTPTVPETPPPSSNSLTTMPFSSAMNLDLGLSSNEDTPGPVEGSVSESKVKSEPPKITGDNLNMVSMPSQAFNQLGPESKPAPEVVLSSPEPKTPALTPQKKSGFAADVPGVSSSNSNNFYSMYSKLTYNVVG